MTDALRLERKTWVEALMLIAGGAAMITAYAVWVAGKMAVTEFGKRKIVELFLTEEERIEREIAEIDLDVRRNERYLERGAVDAHRDDARDILLERNEGLLERRAVLDDKLRELRRVMSEFDDVPTAGEDEKSARVPGAHMVYR
jgi:hypothetical protein